jgi:hypothetical protein
MGGGFLFKKLNFTQKKEFLGKNSFLKTLTFNSYWFKVSF